MVTEFGHLLLLYKVTLITFLLHSAASRRTFFLIMIRLNVSSSLNGLSQSHAITNLKVIYFIRKW